MVSTIRFRAKCRGATRQLPTRASSYVGFLNIRAVSVDGMQRKGTDAHMERTSSDPGTRPARNVGRIVAGLMGLAALACGAALVATTAGPAERTALAARTVPHPHRAETRSGRRELSAWTVAQRDREPTPSRTLGAATGLAARLGGPSLAAAARTAGLEPDWIGVADDRAAIDAVRRGQADVALTTTPPSPTDELAGITATIVHEVVLGFVVRPESGVSALTSHELARLLRGHVSSWRQLGGRAMPVDLIWSANDVQRVILKQRFGDVDTSLDDIATWQGPLPASIDGIAASLPTFRDGRYPFGATIHLVHRRRCGGPAEELALAMRNIGS